MAAKTAVLSHKLLPFTDDFGPGKCRMISMALGAGGLNIRRREHRTVPVFGGFPTMFFMPFGFLGFVFRRMTRSIKGRREALTAVTADTAKFFRRMIL